MRIRRRSAVAGILAATTIIASAPLGASAAPADPSPAVATPLTGEHLDDDYSFVDNRGGSAAPSSAQRSLVRDDNLVARWNRLGTPASVTPVRGRLATGLKGDAEAVARGYLRNSTGLFALRAAAVDDLETVATTRVGAGTVVLLRQRYGGLPAAHDGLVAVAVKGGDVLRVTSSLSPRTARPAAARLKAADALAAALADAGIARDRLADSRVRQVAVPMPGADPRAAYEVVVMSSDADHPLAYTTYVDAIDGKVLLRENLVNFAEDDPHWKVFPATPPANGADTRQTWCATTATGCSRQVLDPATGKPWDVDAATGAPTFTTTGNSAESVRLWGNGTPALPATPRSDREYVYPFTNQWNTSKCDPNTLTSPEQADVDAATANLFAMHNRMHDWSYKLGFTEATWNLQKVNTTPYGKGADAERGNAQQGAATATTRNNANQATPPDGMQPTTNMYMWQPFAGAAYPPCVDGDFDMTVIGHEYTHAISNRMIAGPDSGISSTQGGAMGESWSDLTAMEYLFESGYTPRGNTPYVTGGYVTGDLVTGIRNYDMSNSPLNYSDYGYDRGSAVHSDGEIWSATNFDVRRALISRYGSGTRAQQESCAAGTTPATECPGNRRWIQLVFDSYLLAATGSISMLDMRDNMITADALRFDGANADLLWNTFAARGMGAGATSGPSDADPVPSFASPYVENSEVTFKALGEAAGKPVRLYVGDYDFGAVPIADTDPSTALPETVTLAPGTYRFLAIGAGFGHKRFTQTLYPGVTGQIGVVMPANLASPASGATITGDGTNPARLTDEAEGTVWTATSTGGVAGRQVTVDLPSTAAKLVSRVQLSAFPGAGAATSVMYSTVRQFEILTCNAATGADCATDAGFKVAYTSPANAFDTGQFRPKVPNLILKSFPVRPTLATHVRLRILTNQCTGNPLYAGEQDNDPRAATDCTTNAPAANSAVAAEFQIFSS
ncbi:M36 family metallopeptidase [Pseudosporangium ferrugineum]|uniref:Zn-dependent metalloprotease n=1 Tax=Pseudosporangium ferrugineum TaxID=439699 RepID=A0A2T0SIS5_9ACTN|nr:M36 family metallopeptidase [Pseudosporangium ferrugineum]PRY33297.1 Zn-dependent metalloprotease [Pseudosporangium ferrugineum]